MRRCDRTDRRRRTSPALHQRFYPEVPLKAELSGHGGFYDLTKAERLLAWRPSDDTAAK